jgi:alpha-methylacyl-CoA racemase
MRHELSERFQQHRRDHWSRVFAGSDACVTPVLTAAEAVDDPQLQARNVFVDVDGVRQPAPAPLFSRSPAPSPVPPRVG